MDESKEGVTYRSTTEGHLIERLLKTALTSTLIKLADVLLESIRGAMMQVQISISELASIKSTVGLIK